MLWGRASFLCLCKQGSIIRGWGYNDCELLNNFIISFFFQFVCELIVNVFTHIPIINIHSYWVTDSLHGASLRGFSHIVSRKRTCSQAPIGVTH